jgi:hypothetical protein
LFIASQPVACLSFHTTFRAHQIVLMASGIDWAQACIAALKRPVPEILQGSKAANGVAVSHFTLPGRCIACSHRPQISACAFAAVFSATFFLLDYRLLLWRRSGKEVDGDRVWKNL